MQTIFMRSGLRSRKSNDMANKEYLKILYLAARESEVRVELALKNLFKKEMAVSLEAVKGYVSSSDTNTPYPEYRVDPVSVEQYDGLLSSEGRCC